MMNTKFMLRKSVVVLAIAFAFSGSALSSNAFAVGGVLEGSRIATDANAHRSDRVRHGRERGYKWDPWGHWGAYYGPTIHVP